MQHTAAPPAGQRPGGGSQPNPRPVERAALLRAVLADPGNDVPRHIYADHLDDTGDPDRAAFIRIQCELSRRSWPRSGRALNNQAAAVRPLRAEAARLSGLFARSGLDRQTRRTVDARGDRVAAGDKPYRLAWRRGFAEAVWLPAAAFWGGGDCRECYSRYSPCPVCGGTAVGPALARRLFEQLPLTRVVLTDRSPEWQMFGRRCDWLPTDGGPDHAAAVHPAVFARLPGRAPEGRRRYRRTEHALQALSEACVAYGRRLAGLPPLAVMANGWVAEGVAA